MLPYDLHGKRQRTPLFNKGALRVLSIYTYTQPRHDVPPCIRSPRAPSTLCLSLPVPVVDRSKRHHTGETCEDRVSSSGGRGWVPAEPTTRRLNSFALSPGYRPSRTRRLNLNSRICHCIAPSPSRRRHDARFHAHPRSTQQATTPFARPVPAPATRTALITGCHRRHTCASSAARPHLLSPPAKVLFPLRTPPRFPPCAEPMDLAGITNGVTLKKTETVDKSGPVRPPSCVHVASRLVLSATPVLAPRACALIVAGDRGGCQGRREQGAGRLC